MEQCVSTRRAAALAGICGQVERDAESGKQVFHAARQFLAVLLGAGRVVGDFFRRPFVHHGIQAVAFVAQDFDDVFG